MEPYTLIVFLDEANINNIDIVPSDWLYCDKDDNLLCPFVNDLTEKNKKEIIKRVKTLSCPDKSWKAFRVDVAGTADTYTSAVLKQFTAQQKMKDKRLFKDTNFSEFLRDIILNEYKENPDQKAVKEQHYLQAIGKVINCASDWGKTIDS